jgi:two-component system, OmpR family, KDP operon response regulator KdpE
MPSLANANETDRASYGRSARILVVDEDPGVRRLLSRELTTAGYRVQACEAIKHTPEGMAMQGFDLLMMDIDSPANGGLNFIQVARRLSPVPILALSFRGEEEPLVAALQAGADDYIQKPFRLKELLARTENALRRRALEQGKPVLVVSEELEIDLLRRRVRLHGHFVHLALKSYEVLQVLAESAGNVRTHGQLLDAVWKSRRRSKIEYLRIAIRDLRLKLESDPAHPRYILTERGIGYRLHVCPNQPSPSSPD